MVDSMALASRPMFYILDGYALAYRHYFAYRDRPLMTASGEVTSAVFGFAKMLMDLIGKDKPDYLAVALDAGLSGREELYPDYKGTREKMPDDLAYQIGRIEQVIDGFNIPKLKLQGYEADDVIGTIAKQAEAQGLQVRIFSGDRDLLQLLTDNITVRLFIPQAKVADQIFDIPAYREKYELEPHQLIDYKALVGDTSDNIPGVKGIGDKGATGMLKTYATLENIYENIALLPKGVQQKLTDGRESAYLSRKLATIMQDVPVTLAIEKCLTTDYDKAQVEPIFRELEFSKLLVQLDNLGAPAATLSATATQKTQANKSGQLSFFDIEDSNFEALTALEAAPPPPTLIPTVIVDNEEALAALVKVLKSAKGIAFDTETTSTDQMASELVGISLSVDGENGYYIPVGHDKGDKLPLTRVIEALRDPLTDTKIPKYAHNVNYDFVVLSRYGIEVSPLAFDTMLAEWLRDPLSESIGLKRLALARLQKSMTNIEELIGKGKNQITMREVPIEHAAPYAVADAAFTYQLVDLLRADLQPKPHDPKVDPLWGTVDPPTLVDVFEKIEMPLVPVIASMERAGVLLDVEFLRGMSVELQTALDALQTEIYSLSGGYGEFNISSPKQLNDVLFGKLGLKPAGLRKTTHGFTTDAAALDNLRGEHPIIEKILNYRELSKLKGTYVDALPALINATTGRVHTSYNQAGASTGRLSSSNPNLQNIPIRTELGRKVRGAFIAPEGYVLLSVDYSQVELRIMAHVSKEPNLIEAFAQDQDIHAATAALVHGVAINDVTKDQRGFAKRVNFGLLYGMGAFRLARDSDLTRQQAEAFIKTYFERLPGVQTYFDKVKQIATTGYLATLFGRRRYFKGMHSANRNVQSMAEREAINMPIQGTAADIMKIAMINLHHELQKRDLGAKFLLQVHDELVLEVPEDRLQEVARLVVDVMQSAATLDVELKANAQYGKNWRELSTVEF